MICMVSFTTPAKLTPSTPPGAPAPSRVGHFVAISCSVSDDSRDLFNADSRTQAQLVSPSRDPIGYLGSPNLFEFNIYLVSVDPQGYMQQPISCEGVTVPIVGQIPRCSVVCACPNFQPHEPIESLLNREMTAKEW